MASLKLKGKLLARHFHQFLFGLLDSFLFNQLLSLFSETPGIEMPPAP